MSIVARPYQNEMIAKTRHLLQRVRCVLLQAPTGAGKTIMFLVMASNAVAKAKTVLFVVHRRELVKQTMKAFAAAGVPFGVISPGFALDLNQPVQICSIQSIVGKLHLLKRDPDLIVYDECHHLASKSWTSLYNQFPRARQVGLTATPERLDGSGLDGHFQAMVKGPTVAWLIENGFLSPYRYFEAPAAVSSLAMRGNDFDKKQMAEEFDKPAITGDAVTHYQKHAAGKRAVVFACSRRHSQNISDAFNARGIPAEHVDGETKAAVRDAAIERFRTGETLVLCNVELFGEGFDLPAIECVFLLRRTASLALFLQWCGRALRIFPGKEEALIFDHAGNGGREGRHGFPDDEREWTLAGRRKKKKNGESKVPTKVCPECFATNSAANAECVACKKPFELKDRSTEYDYVDAELMEVSKEERRRVAKKEQAECQTLDDLKALAAARGYKPGWADRIWEARNGRIKNNGQYQARSFAAGG